MLLKHPYRQSIYKSPPAPMAHSKCAFLICPTRSLRPAAWKTRAPSPSHYSTLVTREGCTLHSSRATDGSFKAAPEAGLRNILRGELQHSESPHSPAADNVGAGL